MSLELKTPRLILTALDPADAEGMFAYRSDPAVNRYQCWEPESVAEIRDFIHRQQTILPDTPGTWYQLAIRRRDTGGLAGDAGLHFPRERDHEAEIGITLAPACQGRGYATEALRAMLDYLFGTLAKHRVYASVDPANNPSIRLLERIGFRREAHFRESLFFKGRWVDDIIYAILRREWISAD